MSRLRFALALVAASLLAGCMQSRPPAHPDCAYRAVPLKVSATHPQATLAAAPPGSDPFVEELRQVVRSRKAAPRPGPQGPLGAPAAPQFLVLSGGSQHGAFGAGFFHGLGAVPSYDVVTGVSTGSLQSSFLFLANTPPPGDRTYGWVDGPLAGLIKPGQSSAGDLALAYSIADEGDILKSEGGIFGALTKGELSTFAPLRARLTTVLTPDTLRQVAAEGAKGRKLYVGVTNLDDGLGYAVDLTELAARIDAPGWAGKAGELQQCYIDALIASSSVPPGVPPVTLTIGAGEAARTNLYMDGGARFGVFLEQIERALAAEGPAADAHVTVIVNGTLYGSPWLDHGKPADKWSAATLGMRAVALLENQVYRFSVAGAENFGIARGGLNMAFISNENIPGGEQPDDHVFKGKSCSAWRAVDAAAKPMEFYANYMGCLSDYGRARGAAGQWNVRVDKPAP
jgi:hypothetical protein